MGDHFKDVPEVPEGINSHFYRHLPDVPEGRPEGPEWMLEGMLEVPVVF